MAVYDVGVVGSGVHGASAAFHLAGCGLRVVVYEQSVPAGGPTGLSSAVCRAYYTNSFLARVARESLLMFADFAELTGGGHADFHRTGALYLHPPNDAGTVRQTVRMLADIGTRVDLLAGEDVTGMLPGLDMDGVGVAAWEPDAGYADPVATTQGLLAQAKMLGARLRQHTRVMSIQPGPSVRVIHNAGEDIVERLLIAAGPWTAGLAATVGVELPLVAERHIVARCGLPDGMTMPVVLVDLPSGYYVKPETGDQFLLGPLHPEPPMNPDDPVAGVGDDEAATLVAAFHRRLSRIGNATLRGGWASLYDVSPDWQPVIGEVADHVYVNAGSSGHGFKLAPALGAYVARLVIDDNPHPDLTQFHPDRFRAGDLLASGYGTARIIG